MRMTILQEINLHNTIIHGKFSMLKTVYDNVDGPKLMLEQSVEAVIQEWFITDRHLTATYVMIFFAPSGVVIECVINAVWPMLDLYVAEWGSVYENWRPSFKKHGDMLLCTLPFKKESTRS